jgi:hypothetical protein
MAIAVIDILALSYVGCAVTARAVLGQRRSEERPRCVAHQQLAVTDIAGKHRI